MYPIIAPVSKLLVIGNKQIKLRFILWALSKSCGGKTPHIKTSIYAFILFLCEHPKCAMTDCEEPPPGTNRELQHFTLTNVILHQDYQRCSSIEFSYQRVICEIWDEADGQALFCQGKYQMSTKHEVWPRAAVLIIVQMEHWSSIGRDQASRNSILYNCRLDGNSTVGQLHKDTPNTVLFIFG